MPTQPLPVARDLDPARNRLALDDQQSIRVQQQVVDVRHRAAGADTQVVEHIDLFALAEKTAQLVGQPVLRDADSRFLRASAMERV